jgi:hypothetical protein
VFSLFWEIIFWSGTKNLDQPKINLGINLLNLNFSAQKKLTKAEEECQKSSDYKKKYELTKDLCLELESQIKEYEIVIERMEKVQQKLKESNEDLKTKADSSGSDLIKVNKVQIKVI